MTEPMKLNLSGLQSCLSMADLARSISIKILSQCPYWKCVDNEEFSRLILDGDMAVLAWTDCDYEGYHTEESASFPSEMLLWDSEKLEAWQIAQRKIYDDAQAIEKKNRQTVNEKKERETLAALKKKYEGK